MLEYEWGGSPSTIILPTPGEEPPAHHHHHPDSSQPDHPDRHDYFHPFNPQEGLVPVPATFYHQQQAQSPHPHNHFYAGGPTTSFLSLAEHPPPPPANYFLVPKAEEQSQTAGASRIGLNLGGRTYFSSAEDDFVNRLYGRRRSRPMMMEQAAARCQAEGCNADLTHVKQYHRRHKVCEFHSKASTVVAHGLTQRFCQQCSRFHLLSEFDNGKRSCRRRLADHNRRRRKSNSQPSGTAIHQDISRHSCKSPPPLHPDSSSNSPSDHLTRSPSTVTMALSLPEQRPYHQDTNAAAVTTGACSPASSSSFFFSSG